MLHTDNKKDGKYVILSAFHDDESSAKNMQNHNELLSLLYKDNIRYKELSGSYEGNSELYVIVNYNHIKRLKELGKRYKQINVMVLNESAAQGQRELRILDLDTNITTKIGWLRSVERAVAQDQSWYVEDKTQNKFFIIYKTYASN